jgi:hypothetical protein
MNEKFTKIAANRKKREWELYAIDEDYSHYGPNCPDHPGVRRLHVGLDEKQAKGYSSTDLVWQCPIDKKIYAGEASIAEQTKGFASQNNLRSNDAPIVDEGFEAANKLARSLWHATDVDQQKGS